MTSFVNEKSFFHWYLLGSTHHGFPLSHSTWYPLLWQGLQSDPSRYWNVTSSDVIRLVNKTPLISQSVASCLRNSKPPQQRGKWLQETTPWSPSRTKSHRRSSRFIVTSMSTFVIAFVSHTNYVMLRRVAITTTKHIGWYSIVMQNQTNRVKPWQVDPSRY